MEPVVGANMDSQMREQRFAPIALFVYNRLVHTQRTIDALQKNALAPNSELIIYSDGARDVRELDVVLQVRKYLRDVDGFKSVRVVEREANVGLANAIVSGVTEVCRAHGRVIVLEDDLITSPSFLGFMNAALNLYETDELVGSIHGYWYSMKASLPQSFFLRGASCWGWATWSRAWRYFEPDGRALLTELERRNLTGAFDLEGAMSYTLMLRNQIAGKVDSWAIRWHASMFLAGKLQLSPFGSLVRNIGFDGTGTHGVLSDVYDVTLSAFDGVLERVELEESAEARTALIRYYRRNKRSFLARIYGLIRRRLRS
jgi:hypothetical protein